MKYRVASGCLLLVHLLFGANLLVNPSFELWLDTLGVHMPLGWLTSEILRSGSARRDSNSHSGEWSVRLVGQDTAAFVSSAALVRPGRSYRFTGYARCPGVLGGSFALQFLSLSGRPIGGPQLIPVFYSGTVYRGYSQWVTSPDSAFVISVSCATLSGAELYVDDITLDDTTVQAVEEQSAGALHRRSIRKFLVIGARRARITPGHVYDCLGRQARGMPVPGVYFFTGWSGGISGN